MPNFETCNTNHLTDEQLIQSLLTKDADGKWGIRVTFIDGCEEDAIDCNNGQLTISQALRNCIGINETCGKPALRIANKQAVYLSSIEEYASNAAAVSGGLVVGQIYWNTTTEVLMAVQP